MRESIRGLTISALMAGLAGCEVVAEPPTCEALLERLRAAVTDLELHRFKQCTLDRLVDGAQREMERGRPKTASALVLGLEWQVRVLARVGVVSEEEARGVLDLAADFRACLGVKPKADDWRSFWYERPHRPVGDGHRS